VAITVIAGTASASNGGTPAPTIPGTPQAGDWMIAFYASREATDGTVSLPAGWDQRVNDRGAGGLVAAWTRAWQSGDAAPAFTVGGHATGSSGDSNQAVIHLVRPTAGQTLEFVDASTPSHNASSSTTVGPIDGDSLTVAANGIVFVLGQHRETWTSVATLSGDGLTWAQETDNSNASGADNALAIDWALSNNVSVTDKSYTITGSGGAATGSGFMLFLKEVSAAAALSLSATEGGDSLQASVGVTVTAAASLAEGVDSLSAAASVEAVELLRISWAQLELPEVPAVTSTASLNATELDDSLVGAVAVNIAAALSALEEQDTLSGAASAGAAAEILRISWAQLEVPESDGVTASLSLTEENDSLAALCLVSGALSLAVVEAEDSLTSSASLGAASEILRISWAQLEIPESDGITASLSVTEGGDTLVGTASVSVSSTLALGVTEQGDYLGAQVQFGSYVLLAEPFTVEVSFESSTADLELEVDPFAVTVAFDALLQTSSAALQSSITEENDTLVGTASVAQGPMTASASLLEEADVVLASAAVAISASASVLEAADSLSGQAGVPQISADFAATESDDTVTASASLAGGASVSITEADDLSSASVSVFIVANASMTEEDDDFTGGWGRQLFPAHVGVTNRGRGPRGSSGGGGPLGSSRSKGSITNTEWP
jgi:hypothetical protein